MVSEVQKCLNGFTFSGKCLQCFRGIWPDQFIFNNEQRKIFLDLSKEHKLLAPSSIEEYKPVMNSLFQCSINGIVYIYFIYISFWSSDFSLWMVQLENIFYLKCEDVLSIYRNFSICVLQEYHDDWWCWFNTDGNKGASMKQQGHIILLQLKASNHLTIHVMHMYTSALHGSSSG